VHCGAWRQDKKRAIAPGGSAATAALAAVAREHAQPAPARIALVRDDAQPERRLVVKPLTEVTAADCERVSTGMAEVDHVLGGGLVVGSVALIGGPPGIGKSTLLAQILAATPATGVVLATGEETEGQVKVRADRIGATTDRVSLIVNNDVDLIAEYARAQGTRLLVIDSIQTMVTHLGNVPGIQGSVTQIKACTAVLRALGQETGCVVFLVCHINKDGDLNGPKALQHLVDALFMFEVHELSDRLRTLRVDGKNRGGPGHNWAQFEMTGRGLIPIATDEDGEDPLAAQAASDAAMTPIAQELAYRVIELGGELDRGLVERIAGRLDLNPRGGR
jgi:predicted ATP-dependent serine protease